MHGYNITALHNYYKTVVLPKPGNNNMHRVPLRDVDITDIKLLDNVALYVVPVLLAWVGLGRVFFVRKYWIGLSC